MADTSTITRSAQVEADLSQIRTAVYGRDVREAIANGIEHCYDDNQSAIGNANEAITAANTAARAANNAATAADQAKGRAENAAAAAENVNATASKVQDGPYQITVTNSQGASATIEIPDPAAEVKKKANLEAVTVKKTVGPAEMVTFEDGVDAPAVMSKIKLEPKQDLHGYDHPWVGGAGKNLCPVILGGTASAFGYTATPQQDGSIVVTGTWNGSSNALVYKNTDGVDIQTRFQLPAGSYLFNGGDVNAYNKNGIVLQFYNWDNESTGIRQASGDVSITLEAASSVSVRIYIVSDKVLEPIPSDGIVLRPMIRLATEDDATYEPYSNICPIEGYDAVEVSTRGSNMVDIYFANSQERYGVVSTVDKIAGSFMLSGIASQESNINITSNAYTYSIKVTPGERYFISGTQKDGSTNTTCLRVVFRMNDGVATKPVETSVVQVDVPYGGAVYTAPENAAYIVFYAHTASGADATGVVIRPFMCLASENHRFVPYASSNVQISLAAAGDTVYGGEITLNEDGSGTVVCDTVCYTFIGDEAWTNVAASGMPFFRLAKQADDARFANIKNNSSMQANTYSACSMAVPNIVNNTQESQNSYYIYKSSANDFPYIQVRIGDFHTRDAETPVAEWKEQLAAWNTAGTPLQICYELDTPQTYNLTAIQIQTLVGTNHVWTDAGEITLTYRSDKYAELERRLSQLEALVLEN